MMHHPVKSVFVCLLAGMCMAPVSAKEVKDTLHSEGGDRIILTYNVTNENGLMTVRFTNTQKKLSQQHQKKYKKLDEVAVLFFDRNGNYADMKFEGIETSAFMVPANMNYTRSKDGYFLMSDYPTLQFKLTSKEEESVNLPIYLANYEGKQRYKVFARCGTLTLSSIQAQKAASSNGGSGKNAGGGKNGSDVHAANADNIEIVTEELVDEGLSPADEALIRINSLKSMLEEATEFPFADELTDEASKLRELRFKVTDDEDVSKQIAEVLSLYDAKKKELASAAKAGQQAKDEAQAEAQARNDSIATAKLMASEEEKRNMMWIGGGIGALILLFMGGKQIMQMVNQHKMQKQQQEMMANMMNMAQQSSSGASAQLQGLGGEMNIPGMNGMPDLSTLTQATQNIPGMKDIPAVQEATAAINSVNTAQKTVQQKTHALSKEAEAARQKLKELQAAKQNMGATGDKETTTTKNQTHPSLNDAIPVKYKRLAPKKKN